VLLFPSGPYVARAPMRNGGSYGTRTRGLLRDRQAFNQLNYAPACIAPLSAGLFPSVPSASQLCLTLPESAVTATKSVVID
jgi:hypothetical protein